MRLTAVVLLLVAFAASVQAGLWNARPASAQLATSISVLKTCIPDGDGEFSMTLEQGGVEVANVVENPIPIGCGETATFVFTSAPSGTYDVAEDIVSGSVINTINGCQDITPVTNEDVDCTITNELGDPDTDSVIVNKVCVPPGATGSFEITLLDDTSNPATADVNPITIDCGETATFTGVPVGTYSAEEEILAGNFTEIVNTCQDLDLDVALDPPECTIENQLGDDGTIIIFKDTNPETSGISFDFDGDLGDFDLDDGESATFNGLAPGEYTITENEVAGWDLVVITCDSTEVDLQVGIETVTIDLAAGETVSCTFFNEEEDDDGSITIFKDTNPETSGVSFDFDSDLGDFDLEDDESVLFTDLNDTTFSFVENPPAGWVLVDITCNAADYNTDIPTGGLVVDLQPGEDVTCTFINEPVDDDGSITITKETNPDTNDVFFDFDGDLGDFDLEDNDSVTFIDLSPGTYAVGENEPSGWNLVDIVCSNADVSYSGNTVTIDLDSGEHVTCEFINQQVTVPVVTPTKTPIVVIPVATATPTRTPVPPVVVRPPSAGDGGLLADDGLSWVFGVLSVVAAGGTAWIFIQHRMRRTDRG